MWFFSKLSSFAFPSSLLNVPNKYFIQRHLRRKCLSNLPIQRLIFNRLAAQIFAWKSSLHKEENQSTWRKALGVRLRSPNFSPCAEPWTGPLLLPDSHYFAGIQQIRVWLPLNGRLAPDKCLCSCTYPGRMKSRVTFGGKESRTNIQISAEPGIKTGTLRLEGRDLTNCTNRTAQSSKSYLLCKTKAG